MLGGCEFFDEFSPGKVSEESVIVTNNERWFWWRGPLSLPQGRVGNSHEQPVSNRGNCWFSIVLAGLGLGFVLLREPFVRGQAPGRSTLLWQVGRLRQTVAM